MPEDTPFPRFEATEAGVVLRRPGVKALQHFPRETAARFYRQLQEIVAPNDRRILDAAKEIVGALNENQAVQRYLHPYMAPWPLLRVARWAREYREPKTPTLAAEISPGEPGGQLEADESPGFVEIIARDVDHDVVVYASHANARRLAQKILAIVGPGVDDSSGPEALKDAVLEVLEGRLADTWEKGVLLHGDCEEIAEELALAVTPFMTRPRPLDELAPALLERIDEALSTWRASIGPARLTGTGWSLADLLEKAFAGPPQPPETLAMIREATEGQVDDLANHIAEAIKGASPELTPHELAALREAVSHARCRLPDLVETARRALGCRLVVAEAALRKLGAADDDGPEDSEPTEAENLAERVREIEERLDGAWAVIRRSMESADAAKLMLAPRAASDIGAEMLRQHFENRAEDLKAQGLTDGMIEAVVNGEGAETEAEAALRVLRAQKKAIDAALVVADKMEAAENTLARLDKMTRNEPYDDAVKRRVTTPPRPEKDVSSQEED